MKYCEKNDVVFTLWDQMSDPLGHYGKLGPKGLRLGLDRTSEKENTCRHNLNLDI